MGMTRQVLVGVEVVSTGLGKCLANNSRGEAMFQRDWASASRILSGSKLYL